MAEGKLIIDFYYNLHPGKRKSFYITVRCEKKKEKNSPRHSYLFIVFLGNRRVIKRKQSNIYRLIKTSDTIEIRTKLYKFYYNYFDCLVEKDIKLSRNELEKIIKNSHPDNSSNYSYNYSILYENFCNFVRGRL